jgi:hypothetical protein
MSTWLLSMNNRGKMAPVRVPAAQSSSRSWCDCRRDTTDDVSNKSKQKTRGNADLDEKLTNSRLPAAQCDAAMSRRHAVSKHTLLTGDLRYVDLLFADQHGHQICPDESENKRVRAELLDFDGAESTLTVGVETRQQILELHCTAHTPSTAQRVSPPRRGRSKQMPVRSRLGAAAHRRSSTQRSARRGRRGTWGA